MDTATLAFLTDFGDQAVILPAFLAATIVLVAQRRWVLAGAWVFAIAGVLGTMLVLKLADQACGWQVPLLGADRLDLVNPSGHAASAAVLWGSAAALLATGRATVATALLTAGAVALLIGFTRVGLGAHTLSETVAGGLVGLTGAGVFGWLTRAGRGGARTAWPVAAAVAAMALTHGRHLAAEPTIHSTAVVFIRAHLPACEPPADSRADRWLMRRRHDPA